MKHYTFDINNKKSNTTFRTNNTTKSLDDLILAGVINSNKYLFKKDNYIDRLYRDAVSDHNGYTIDINYRSGLKDNSFINAAKFLASYSTNRTHKFTLNKLYYLTDGTPVIFYDDEIQIGYDIYKYNQFGNIDFLNTLTPSIKKTIINITINL